MALDGVRLLTDPVLRARVAHLRRRGRVDPDALRDVGAVLVSHAHYDHLDLPSLERLGRTIALVVPRGLGTLLLRRGFVHVQEVDVGEAISVGPVAVTATYAEHEGGRGLFAARSPALGFVVEGSKRLYFAGDTDVFEGMNELGALDLALLPIWGWGPTLGRGRHMDPERAAQAVALLEPRIAVPIHWGTYHPFHHGVRRLPAFLTDPPGMFVEAAARLAPNVDVRVLEPGQSLEVS
jgi:L-ascorbate metabolism protein UlaG (beta-lactamase superfamily)